MTTQDDDNIDSLLKRMHKMDVTSAVHKDDEEQNIKDFLSQLDTPDIFQGIDIDAKTPFGGRKNICPTCDNGMLERTRRTVIEKAKLVKKKHVCGGCGAVFYKRH